MDEKKNNMDAHPFLKCAPWDLFAFLWTHWIEISASSPTNSAWKMKKSAIKTLNILHSVWITQPNVSVHTA